MHQKIFFNFNSPPLWKCADKIVTILRFVTTWSRKMVHYCQVFHLSSRSLSPSDCTRYWAKCNSIKAFYFNDFLLRSGNNSSSITSTSTYVNCLFSTESWKKKEIWNSFFILKSTTQTENPQIWVRVKEFGTTSTSDKQNIFKLSLRPKARIYK